MNDQISVFRGILPDPVAAVNWQDVLENIRSDKYKSAIETTRQISDPAERRKFKTKLPSVTFCGYFAEKRQAALVTHATGFIIPDLDHLPEVEKTFELLTQDECIWFAFRSPSGDGIKCGIRAENISTDEDIKNLYSAVEKYFSEVYGIKIDPACKDISRLTFVSYDPDLFINPNPFYFNINQWKEDQRNNLPFKPVITNNGWKEKYGLKVLESCCLEIQNSQPGNQHQTRLKRSKLIGGFIPEYLDEQIALSALEQAVSNSGAKNIQAAMKTIKDGIDYGKKQPITVEQQDNFFHVNEQNEQNEQTNDCSTKMNIAEQLLNKNEQKTPYNIQSHVLAFIDNSVGSFTTEQIYREFFCDTRQKKQACSQALYTASKRKLISKDKSVAGKWHIIDAKIDWIDLDAAPEEKFPILLPFDLQEHVLIPPKAIIVLAGSTNAGKTAYILNTLKMNRDQKYKKTYLMSEMGPGEYVSRIKTFGEPLNKWKEIKAASKSYDFNGAIEHHNKDGLTCIDYLEEVEGEYFKIASNIRSIYDALGDGVAMVAIQKKSSQNVARGGEGTMEKSRLYMTLDHLCTREHSIVCALQITKLKNFIGKNLQNHELHFEITKGSQITKLMDWTPCHRVDRDKCKIEYERERTLPATENDSVDPIYFHFSDNKKTFRITEDTIVKWGVNFQNIDDVYKEVEKLARQHNKKPFIKHFTHLVNILDTIDKKERG